jgi:hypothetical protein
VTTISRRARASNVAKSGPEEIQVTEINADLLSAIEKAGRIVGQVQDSPTMTASERAYALSRACDALGGTYFKTTGRPLEWWRYEAAIDKATKEVN